MLNKSTIKKKTMEVGALTLASRLLGMVREVLLGSYLGATALSDVFINAFSIPNSLRKMFAEGALSAVLVPRLVHAYRHEGLGAVNSLVMLSFIIFEGMVIALCALIIWQAEFVFYLMAPGFSPEQVAAGICYLYIVLPFILFISSSAVLAGALQSVGHFFIPACAPILLNIIFIGGVLICKAYYLPIEAFCWFILVSGLLQFLLHLAVYLKLNFKIVRIQKEDFKNLAVIMIPFALSMIGMGCMEIGLFIDKRFASYLPEGSTSLIYYAYRFMGIPIGVFATALSTVLLPHFSHLVHHAPKRLNFYLLEVTKSIFWIMIPVALIMSFFADKIFITLFLSEKFTMAQAHTAGWVLIMYLIGLFFFAINKIILSLYYALRANWSASLIIVIATVCNYVFNLLLFIPLQAPGIALATTGSAIIQTVLSYIVLSTQNDITLPVNKFLHFVGWYLLQVGLFLIPFGSLYYLLKSIIEYVAPYYTYFLINGLGFWLWVTPLAGLFLLSLWITRRFFGIHLFFIE
jgi:putative peptidoglycan lipid II flippase